MKFVLRGALALLAGVVLAPTARADVVVRAPFVRVQVGPGVYIRAPFFRLAVPPRLPAWPSILPAPEVIDAGAPPSVPLVVPSASVPRVGKTGKAITLDELARTFQPRREGGKYEMIVESPCTGRPVTVCFTLPPGYPKRIVVRKSELVIRYGPLRAVILQFDRDGSYKVRG